MKLFKTTYRFFSALTLLLFVSSIVLPASISAATLFCDMEMETMAQPYEPEDDTCCEYHGMYLDSEAAVYVSNDSCTYQEVCAESVSSNQTAKKAIPQLSKSFVAAFVFTNIFVGDTEIPGRSNTESETVTPQKNEPIFLLNSTFLN